MCSGLASAALFNKLVSAWSKVASTASQGLPRRSATSKRWLTSGRITSQRCTTPASHTSASSISGSAMRRRSALLTKCCRRDLQISTCWRSSAMSCNSAALFNKLVSAWSKVASTASQGLPRRSATSKRWLTSGRITSQRCTTPASHTSASSISGSAMRRRSALLTKCCRRDLQISTCWRSSAMSCPSELSCSASACISFNSTAIVESGVPSS